MSHKAQRDFINLVSTFLPTFFLDAKVLEFGSLNINGTVRDFFTNCQYIGIDIGPGRDVDIVCEAQLYDAPDDSFDQVISCETMEHNLYWAETFSNMIRLCRPGGLIVMTCATTGRSEHGTTRFTPSDSPLTIGQGWDYYRNLTNLDFAAGCNLAREFVYHRFWSNWRSFDLYFLGIKSTPNIIVGVTDAWDHATQATDNYIAEVNKSKICKYRAIMGRLGGDKWFDIMRDITQKLDYIHNN